MTQSGLSDFSSSGEADDGAGDSTEAEREELAAQEAAAVAGGGRGHVSDVVDVDEAKFPKSTGTVELMITQIDYAVEGYGSDEYPVVHVFGRRPAEHVDDAEDDTVEHLRVLGVEPYFYVPTAELDRDPVEEYDVVIGTREENVEGEGYESIRGESLTRIVTRTPRDVGSIRDDFATTFEADILFPNRFLIDNGLNGGIRVEERRLDDEEGTIQVHEGHLEPAEVDAEMRVNTFDIEVDDRRGFPENGEEPIICLTSHDSYDDQYVVWLYDAPEAEIPPPEDLPGYEGIVDDEDGEIDFEVRTFDEEAAMLDAFVEYLDETDPDLLTGWNFEDFDAPYVLDRLEVLDDGSQYDLSVDRLSRIGEVWRSGWGGPDIKGRVVFDLLYAYKRTMFTELESYRLDAVGERELGVGKERYTGDIGDLWEQDPERLLEYSIRDVELCVEIDRKQDVIAFWDEARKIVGCKLEDATTPGDAVDMYVLHMAYGTFALPSKGQQESEDFEGGAVFDPISGVREMVSVLDLKCFSGDTDVATPGGLRNIRDLSVGDRVYTLNPQTFECEVKPVVDTQSYNNQYGELHHVSGNTHDLKLTENHRFLVSKNRGWDGLDPDDFELREYRDIPDTERFAFPNHQPMAGAKRDRFRLFEDLNDGNVVVYAHDGLSAFRAAIPGGVESELDWANGTSRLAATDKRTGKYLIPLEAFRDNREQIETQADEVFLKYDRGHAETPLSFEMDDWLELIGWFVTEGSFVRGVPGIVLHQQNEAGRSAIEELLDRMRLNYNVGEDRYTVSNRNLHDWFIEHCGDGYDEKRLPQWVFELDASHLEVLLETMVNGDGSRTESGLRKFWTKSDQLKTDIVRLAIRCGEKPTVSEQSDGTWYVSIGKEGSMHKRNTTTEQHDGQVHCITAADNHVVLAGRNGHLQWVGQSLYPMSMVTINASPETKVDPEKYDGETYQTPTGVHFRKTPDGIIREMVNELLDEREEKKALRNEHEPGTEAYEQYDRQQGAVKVLMNSLYGVFGWDRFRLYDREMSAGVTSTNREVIDFTADVTSELNREVTYGDSVTGDRPVVVRDPDGSVRILPIEDLFERADRDVTAEVVVTADGGPVASNTLEKDRRQLPGWEALSLSADGEPEWKPIERAIRHETDKPVVNLQHKLGESTTTRDHSYVVDDGGEFVETAPEDVEEPVRVPGLPEVDTVDTIDVYEVLDGYVREYEDGRSVGSENAESKTKRVHADDEWVWFGHEHHDAIEKGVKVRRHIDLRSKEGRSLVRLLAAYVTEGSASTIETTDSKFGASIAESREEWLEGLHEDYNRLFEGATAGIVASDAAPERTVAYETEDGEQSVTYDDTTRKLQMMNELSAVFFRGFAGRTSRGKRIPGFVFNLPDDLQQLFVDVLVEGDGSREFPRYSAEYCERNFDFETASRELAAGLSMLLTQRERKHSLKYRDAKDSYTIRACDYYRGGRDPVVEEVDHDGYVYDLSVADNENFVDGVGGIVLHNTDSVMLSLGQEVDKQEAIDTSFEIADHINERYDDFAREELNADDHRFQIEFEKLYRRFFQAGKKKRYAGHIVWKEGKDVDDIDITGFEYKRSDIAQITKEVQQSVIETIVTGDDIDEDLEEVKSYLVDVIAEVLDGDIDLDEIGIPGGIGKKLDAYETPTAQVRGAKYANLMLGTNFGSGSKPKRLYIEKVHPDFWERMEAEKGLDPQRDHLYGEFKRDPDVICFEYADQVPDEFEVDWEKMLDKTLQGPIERVIEALGMSWEEVKTGQEQTGLGSFM
ncbi:DNA polymerase domain-containing protein [Halorubrum amylolyticum]|uniref:DNA polymerase domain-containing protein n=1 Tax=Halorubrum amylolyticum TaxID=2508724 RepID=UPI001008EA86|nr:DNA polymerase domain-containing protein [Halorubrum amylolyticum]